MVAIIVGGIRQSVATFKETYFMPTKYELLRRQLLCDNSVVRTVRRLYKPS